MKLEIHAAKLAEGLAMVLPAAGKDAMMPALMAVAFHVRDDGSLALVTTDRFMLAEYIISAEHVVTFAATREPDTFVVPVPTATEWAKLAKREAKFHPSGPVTLTIEGQTATLSDYETSQSGRLVDGDHVNHYDRLIPAPDNGGLVAFHGFAPAYLTAIAKISAAAGKKLPVRLDFQGESKAALLRVKGIDAFRAAVMPVRVSDW